MSFEIRSSGGAWTDACFTGTRRLPLFRHFGESGTWVLQPELKANLFAETFRSQATLPAAAMGAVIGKPSTVMATSYSYTNAGRDVCWPTLMRARLLVQMAFLAPSPSGLDANSRLPSRVSHVGSWFWEPGRTYGATTGLCPYINANLFITLCIIAAFT